MITGIIAKVTLLLVAVWGGRWLLSRASAATGQLLQAAGLAAVLLLPLAVIALPSWQLAVPVPELTTTPTLLASGTPGSVFDLATPSVIDEPSARTSAIPPALAHRMGGQLIDPVRSAASRSMPGLAVVWLLGVTWFVTRSVLGWARMSLLTAGTAPLRHTHVLRLADHCCRTLGIARRPEILIGCGVQVPMLWGFLRPTLLLPTSALGWSTDRMRVVLLHELAHLRRGDGLSLLIGRLATAAYWFHPLAWLVDSGARRDAEKACDDVVLSCGQRPSDYARHLVEIAQRLPQAQTIGEGAVAIIGRSQLEERIRSILHPRLRRGLNSRGTLATFAVVVVVLAGVSSVRLVADTPAVDESGQASRDVAREMSLELLDAEPAPQPFLIADNTNQKSEIKIKKKPRVYVVHDDHDSDDHGDHHGGHAHGSKQRGPGAEAFEKAYELHYSEQFEQAIALFKKAAEADFNVGTSSYNVACGYARLGDTEQAMVWLDRALEAGFDDLDMLYEDADFDPVRSDRRFREMLEEVGGDSEDRLHGATKLYEEMLDRDVENGHAWFKVGTDLLSLREMDAAIDALGRAVDLLEDQNATALYNLACAHAVAGNRGQALDTLEQAIHAGFGSEERFENDRDLNSLRGDGRFAELAELSHFLSLERFHQDGKHDENGYSEERWAPAAREYREFVQRNPDVGRGWFNLGWALHFSHQHDQAIDAFQNAVDRDFRVGTSTYNIACAHAMNGNSGAALDWLERAIDHGFVSAGHMREDSDLKSLHENPRFEELAERADELNENDSPMWQWWKRQAKRFGL